ncbi:putative F-box protein At4g10190 [Brassica napus]|uniref:putative F-box protein At4g10190 n=1 Tax=Brassica napus TaxID=3708 RepID=UPI00207A234E|nr:putative F-box protein At4g10190 [Brassica napus]
MVRVANVKSLSAMYLEIPTSVGVKRFSGGGVIHCDGLLLSWTTANLRGIHVWNPCSQFSVLITLSSEINFMDTFGIEFAEREKYILLRIHEVRERIRNVEIFSSGSWNIIGNLVDWYIISSRDGLSLGNNMVWLAREKVSTTDSIPSFHFKYESFTKLCDSPVGSYLDGITSLNIYKSESERLSYIYAPRYKRYKAENLGLFPWPEANGPVEW